MASKLFEVKERRRERFYCLNGQCSAKVHTSWKLLRRFHSFPGQFNREIVSFAKFLLSFMQCSGSMTFWGGSGSGSGSSDPCFRLMDSDPDPDPAIFVIDLQDASKELIFNTIFSAYYFLKVHLHNFQR